MPTARGLLPHLTRDELIAMVAPDALFPLHRRGEDGIAATILSGVFASLSPKRNDT